LGGTKEIWGALTPNAPPWLRACVFSCQSCCSSKSFSHFWNTKAFSHCSTV